MSNPDTEPEGTSAARAEGALPQAGVPADTSGTNHSGSAVPADTTTSTLNASDEAGNQSSLAVPPAAQAAPLSPIGGTSSSANLSSLPQEITSPHQLTDWVDAALNRLEAQFASLSRQYESRSQEMSDRIDDLEKSITNLINGVTVFPP